MTWTECLDPQLLELKARLTEQSFSDSRPREPIPFSPARPDKADIPPWTVAKESASPRKAAQAQCPLPFISSEHPKMLPPEPHCSFWAFVMDSRRAEQWFLYAFNLFLHCAQGRLGELLSCSQSHGHFHSTGARARLSALPVQRNFQQRRLPQFC